LILGQQFQKKSYRPWDLVDSSASKKQENIEQKTDLKHIESVEAEIVESNTGLNLRKELRNLYGAQRVVMQYLLKQIEEEVGEEKITKNISINDFVLTCKIPPNTVKATLQKLKAKKLVATYESKPGRGGFGRYNIQKIVYEFFAKNL
jgi:hypothetical protein